MNLAGDDQAVLNASGYVTARRRATVSSRITGKVVSVHVEEGMAVRQGQVLARLDDSTTRAMLQLAEAQLASTPTPGRRTAMRRSDRAVELMARRTPWILRGMARLAPATGRR